MPVPPPNYTALGRLVKALRTAQGLSLDALAECSGVSRKSVVNVEQAHKVPDLRTLHGLAHGLGVPLSDLVRALCEDHREDEDEAPVAR